MAGYDNLQQVAQVLKSNGTDGELVVGFRDIAPEDINIKEPVFIFFDGLPVPFFIESFNRRGTSKALIRLTDIESMEDAEELVGKAVFADEEALPEISFEEDGFAALVGWMVLTLNKDISEIDMEDIRESDISVVGEIIEYHDIPNNPCIEVDTKNGAVMIPLHEDLIVSVDPENQEIVMQIPKGLI